MSPLTVLAVGTLVFGACGGTSAEPDAPYTELRPVDVAVLFPLPATRSADTLLHADAAGAHGALVPGWSTDPLFRCCWSRTTSGWPP